MPTSVRLDSETESLIGQLARTGRITKSEILRQAIRDYAKRSGPRTSSPYTRIRHLIGVARGGPVDLSVRTGEKLRGLLQRKAGLRGSG